MDLNRLDKLTVAQIKLELKKLKIEYHTLGSGYVSRRDLIDIYKNHLEEKGMSKLNVNRVKKMRVSELIELINTLNINVKGTGYHGRVLKRDMIGAIVTSQVKKVGSDFTMMMPTGVIQAMLKKLNIRDILNFCRTSKTLNKACTDIFWKEIAQIKLGQKELGKFKNWAQLVLELRYGSSDLYTIGKKYQFGLMTRQEAEQKLNELTQYGLKWEGSHYNAGFELGYYLEFNKIDDSVTLLYNYTKNEIIYDPYTNEPFLYMTSYLDRLLDNSAEDVQEYILFG